MPRHARIVFPGIPHHITQRGNRRENIFFTDEDRTVYLEWLQDYCSRHGVDILSYCLMSNHIHLVAVPETEDSLQQVLKPLHMRYAQRINRKHGWKGHVWQGRFFSSALDDRHTWSAIRYVERNPVRAGIVSKPEEYPWSSAAAHCGLQRDPVLTSKSEWTAQFKAMGDWSAWLSATEETEMIERLRMHVEKGLPCGSRAFIHQLGERIGRSLEIRSRGRPRRESIKG